MELVQQYARRINPEREGEVVSAILVAAQLVAAYRTQKADHAIAPPDISIAAAEIPKELHSIYKQISKEIKRSSGQPIGMANLTAISILETVARYRPELRAKVDKHIHENIIGVSHIARPVADRNTEEFDEEAM
jgi:Rieske Fe-S protein